MTISSHTKLGDPWRPTQPDALAALGIGPLVMTAEDANFSNVWDDTCAVGKRVVQIHP